MNKQVRKKIENLIKDECKSKGLVYNKAMLRRAKSIYPQVPDNKKHLIG